MIISVSDFRKRETCNKDDKTIAAEFAAIEAIIRQYTNNNFQKRGVRFIGRSAGNFVYGTPAYFGAGDTVQITSENGINDGLYQVVSVGDNYLELDADLMALNCNMVTKVEYPADVVQCAIDLYKWKLENGDKVGIKSETLSRHSVTYEDSATLFMGYPVGILSGLKLYKKARC